MPSPLWNQCVDRLREQLSEADLDAWIAPLQPVQQNDALTLLAPNRYVLEYVQANLIEPIEKVVATTGRGIGRVTIEIGAHSAETPPPPAAETAADSPEAAPKRAAGGYQRGALFDEYTFAKHIEGDSNNIARAAAMRVSDCPGESYNPLFIYGQVGLGKTHLMQAAGHRMRERNPNAKIVYVHSETFVNQIVDAVRTNSTRDFKRHYRSIDALLVDDIQFFARKTQSQEEFFHTFNTLSEKRRQIIVTSDRLPTAISDVEDRLLSRFGAGLQVCIEAPELETRVAILEKRAFQHGISLPNDVAYFIAHAFRSNVRELVGALHRVFAHAEFTGRRVDTDLAHLALRDSLRDQQLRFNIDSIQRTVADYYRLRVADLTSKLRTRSIARPRQLAMYLAKEYTELSLTKIGDRFGGRDHTTVLHAHRTIKKLMEIDAQLKLDCANVRRILGV